MDEGVAVKICERSGYTPTKAEAKDKKTEIISDDAARSLSLQTLHGLWYARANRTRGEFYDSGRKPVCSERFVGIKGRQMGANELSMNLTGTIS